MYSYFLPVAFNFQKKNKSSLKFLTTLSLNLIVILMNFNQNLLNIFLIISVFNQI